MGVIVVVVGVVVLVGVLHRRVPVRCSCADRSESATPIAASGMAISCTASIESASTTHDSTAPRNGAVAKIT